MSASYLNRLTLEACVVEKSPLRNNLAGCPVVDLVLQNQSDQEEIGSPRQTQFEIAAVAMGDAATAVDACVVGSYYKIQGFLNRKSLKSVKLRLHITHISPVID